jgi:hypothetical protein
VSAPDVDTGRGGARHILAVVMETTQDGFYRLGTRDRLLKQPQSRSQTKEIS